MGVFPLTFRFLHFPGTKEERGVKSIREQQGDKNGNQDDKNEDLDIYDIPFITEKLKQHPWTAYIPVSPTYKGFMHAQQKTEVPQLDVTPMDIPLNSEVRHRPNPNHTVAL